MKRISLLITTTLLLLSPLVGWSQEGYTPSKENLQARKEFSDSRFGIFIHWGIYAEIGKGEWVMHNENLNYREYPKLAEKFNPTQFDASQWVKAIKKSGAKYITFTSRHHDGFSMYNTKASKYNVVKATPFKRDIIGELSKACQEEGIKLHIYYSHLDWGRTDFWPRGRTGNGTGRPDGKKGDWNRYLKFMDRQLTELLTNYGPIGAIWFDGVWDMDSRPREEQPSIWNLYPQYELIHTLQPSCLIGNNHHLLPFPGEDIQIFERDIPGKNEYGLSGQEISPLPLETCQTMNRSWGHRATDHKYKSSVELIQYLIKTAGKGANLLLNIAPLPDGSLPLEAIERLNAIGDWLSANGETIYGTEGGIIPEQSWGVTTMKGNTLYLHILDSSKEIVLPLKGHNILNAKGFKNGTKVPFTHTHSGVKLDLSSLPTDSTDLIVEVELAEITPQEEEYLSFLYKYMPLPDMAGYDFNYWLENVRRTIKTMESVPWEVPQREFLHFVLPVRANNEALDDFRTKYADILLERIKGMDIVDAALEVNHWCHEMATYRPSDARTLSPEGTITCGLGRCGEESVLAVAALRAAGIPARQVYTPRWAHTDDNHAWVEVYTGDRWHFMGACEPEPVLDLAWFNAPVSRAMLLHTRAFGDYHGPEDVISRTLNFTEINVINSYIPTRKTTVKVLDTLGREVSGAWVEFKIYNYAEFYSVAKYQTDSCGIASLYTGCGDIFVKGYKDGLFGMGVASDDMTTITLNMKFGQRYSLDFNIVPPVENPIPSTATPEQVAENQKKLAEEDSIRLSRSKENTSLSKFKKDYTGALAEQLLCSLSEKDLIDVTYDVLKDGYDHIKGDFTYYRDSPRILYEPLRPFFKELSEGLAELHSPNEIAQWIKENIVVDNSLNGQRLQMPPKSVWESKIADSRSREIFFVAACRALGFEARIDPITGKTQYKDGSQSKLQNIKECVKDGQDVEEDTEWKDLNWGVSEAVVPPKGKIKSSYKKITWLENPLYYKHFTISKVTESGDRLLSFDEDIPLGYKELLEDGLEVDEGYYQLTSGIRMADGGISVHLELFDVKEGGTENVPLIMRDQKDRISVIGSIDAEQKYLPLSNMGEEKSILATTGRGYFSIVMINDFSEPVIHTLRQLSSISKELNEWDRTIIVLCKDQNMMTKCSSYLKEIKKVVYGVDTDSKVLKMFAQGCALKKETLPITAIADSFGRVVYLTQGYDTSLSEQFRSIINEL